MSTTVRSRGWRSSRESSPAVRSACEIWSSLASTLVEILRQDLGGNGEGDEGLLKARRGDEIGRE
jgi:hypothetical protein